jgi:hypothetical protein
MFYITLPEKEMLMRPAAQLILFGSLQKKIEGDYNYPIRLDLKEPASIIDVLKRFKIPPDLVQLAMVNHRAVHKDSMIKQGDRLALFPREYIVFADWKDFRF